MELHLLRLNPELPLSRRTLRYVSASRREKVERMRHPEDRKRSLTAELMLRCAASRICGIPPRNLTIANGPYGKPYLPDVTDFHFNLSHSGQYVVLAIGHLPLGVDVERMQPMEDTMKSIAARFFTDREYRVLLSKSGDALCRTFYTLWTSTGIPFLPIVWREPGHHPTCWRCAVRKPSRISYGTNGKKRTLSAMPAIF